MSAATDAEASWRENSDNQTRLAFGQALLEIGARESRSVVLSADTQDLLGIRPWIERFPVVYQRVQETMKGWKNG